MKYKTLAVVAAALAAIGLSGALSADSITFKNGDRITGTILDMAGGKIRIKSDVAGEIIVDSLDVATFSTDAPIDLQLPDGNIVKEKVEAVGEGRVAIGGEDAKRELEVGSLKSINPRTGWKGSVVAGGVFTRGNTDTDAANVSFDLTRRSEIDRYTLGGQYNWGRQKEGDGAKRTTIENWTAQGKYDYFFNDKLYGFASMRVDHDRIAGLYVRLVPSVGLGYQWQEGPVWNFWTEGGLAYVYEKYYDPSPPIPGFDDEDGNISLRLAYHYDRKINDKLLVFHNLEYYPSLESLSNYLVITDLGLRASMTARMFAEFKVELRHNSEPAEGFKDDDLRYVVGLGWTF